MTTLLLALHWLGATASAAPTPEEEALRAALDDRRAEAIRALEKQGDADSRWLAGRYALLAKDPASAARLFDGPEPRSVWGRIEVLAARGDPLAAARDALKEMDAALAGTHRDALSRLLVDWARERAPTDPYNAGTFLASAIGFGPSEAVRRDAEDAWFRLPTDSSIERLQAAIRRTLAEPDSVPARLPVVAGWEGHHPGRAAAAYADLMRTADRDDAFAAASRLVGLPVPHPMIVEPLVGLGGRFPEDEPIARLRLDHARRLASVDEAAGTAALRDLESSSFVGTEARVARAETTRDPQARRALWLALASAEGVTALGDRARAEARQALLDGVAAATEGPERQALAAAALKEPDGAREPLLQYHAIPAGKGRVDALWTLSDAFPNGPWCDELATSLVETGAPMAVAERYTETCSSDTTDAAALQAHATEDTSLWLAPAAGRLDVISAAATELSVSQHRVDAEALFRATDGHPLDVALDAFLLEPDASWTVPLTAGQLATTPLEPRGAADLVALTVRAGDQRATAFVRPDPLDVSMIRRADDVAIAVFRAERPVPGAVLLVEDDAGVSHRGRTDGDGIARFSGLPSGLRVMATHGRGLGFATMSYGESEEVVDERWAVVVWDRAVPDAGDVVDVQVFGTRPAGDAVPEGPLAVVTRTLFGQLLDRQPVTLTDGVGHVRVFAQGGARVELVGPDDETLAGTTTRRPTGQRERVRIAFEPADPRPGDPVVATVSLAEPVGPGGLAGSIHVETGWSSTSTPVVLGAEGARLEIPLAPWQLEPVTVTMWFEDGRAVSNHVVVQAAPPPGPLPPLPSLVAVGQAIDVARGADTWILATTDTSVATRWFGPGQAVTLSEPGIWRLCAWREHCGPSSPITVTSATDAAGRWTGAPTLAAVAAEDLRDVRIVSKGQPLATGDARGTRQAWLTLDHPALPAIPIRGSEPPEIAVSGALARGETSTLEVGRGLPAGTKLWAFLRDAPDGRRTESQSLSPLWDGATASLGDRWNAQLQWGQEIAAALLDEEERLAEQREVQRMDFGFSPAAEEALGGYGYGMGSGGFGSRGAGGVGSSMGSSIVMGGRGQMELAGEPRALGVHQGVAPGALAFTVPAWIGAADLEVVARTPDGRWSTRMVRLTVGGAPLAQVPTPAPWVAPDAWDGDRASLVPLARSLPIAARVQALTSLERLGVLTAKLPLLAAWASERAPGGPEVVLAHHLAADGGVTDGGADLAAIPDPRRAERAVAALSLASVDPERARAAASRLLGGGQVEPWVQARAGLALWVAGAARDAESALTGTDPLVAAARAVATGKADPTQASAWWATARSEGAHAGDRALAIHALALIPRPGAVNAGPSRADQKALIVEVEQPIAELHGERFHRGYFTPGAYQPPPLTGAALAVPRLRTVPIRVFVPPSPVPTRLLCPSGPGLAPWGPWTDLPPSSDVRVEMCRVTPVADGTLDLTIRWFAPDGSVLGEATPRFAVSAPKDSSPTDPMSEHEKVGLGIRLARTGDADGLAMLEELLRTSELPAPTLADVSESLLLGRQRAGAPKPLIAAFQAYREHVPDGVLALDTAAALAHAYADQGDPERALAAARIVLDARFKEELGAVSQLQANGLGLTALKLLRELLERYPEVPTVISARYLAPSMLLARAEGDEDRLGYTRSSLRHTAAAELAGFLLIHPDSDQAPEAAALLADALHALGDPERERALAGPLARRYGDHPAAWRLSLADARANYAAGRPAESARILASLDPASQGLPEVELERGRVFEALGKFADARLAYQRSGEPEAWERLAWLDRNEIVLPPMMVLTPGTPPVITADLPRGTEVSVAAIRVQLEAALLRDNGTLDASALNVVGLKPTASRTFTVGPDGDVPLPTLPEGAYVVTVATGGLSQRLVVIRSDAELTVENRTSGGTMIHLADTRGNPLPGAQLWLFTGGTVETARTDLRGSVWVPFGGGQVGVVARLGDRYATAKLGEGGGWGGGAAGAAPKPAYKEMLDKNEAAYDELFRQEAQQRVRADGL